jgi:hypothetical protein
MCFIRRFILALLVMIATAPFASFAQADVASDAIAAASAASAAAATATSAASAAQAAAASAASVPLVADPATEKQFLTFLLVGSFIFVGFSLALILVIAWLIRTSFWKHAAELGPSKWRNYLLQLPLGAPEGSVRALLSLFVVVFGLLVIALQGYLRLGNVEAIAGFVGMVITFYFTSRANEQARKTAQQNQDALGAQSTATTTALQQANQAAVNAAQSTISDQHDLLKQTVAAVTTIANSAVQGTAQPAASAPDPAAAATTSLSDVKDKLTDLQQVARGVSASGVGAEVLPNAAKTLATTSSLLGVIEPLLKGSPDPATVSQVLQNATSQLPALEASGLPGVLAEAVQVIGDVATPIVVGLPGGPIGIVGGVLIAAIHLAGDAPQLKNFKAAVLAPPFDPVLLPDTADKVVAPTVLRQSPLMSVHFPNASVDDAMKLMTLAVMRRPAPDGAHYNAADLADLCASDIANHTDTRLPPRNPEFASRDDLMQAFDEYLSVLVRMGASSQLSGTVTLPATGDGKAPVPLDLSALAQAASSLVAVPAGAAELERIVSLGEALGKLPLDPAKVLALVTGALNTAVSGNLVQTEATRT